MGNVQGEAGAPEKSGDALRVFISYSRADLAAAEAVADALVRNGFDVKIDVRDLPYGEEWQAELAGFIAGSDTVVWLVSPDSVRSRWVNWELGEVVRLSKRLVPVRVREVDADTLPESLGRINLLPNRGAYDPALHEQALVDTLNTNRAWLRKGTSLAEAAAEWNATGRDGARLLRGKALKEAEAWSAAPPRDAPAPPSETLELILASRRAQQWRRRIGAATAVAAAVVATGLAWFGQVQAQNAQEQERVALAASAQRRNEVSRKLLEAENQVGTAVSGLAAAEPGEADSIGRVRAAWAERLTPIRDLLKSDGPKLWQVSGKQVLSAGDRLAAYEAGVAIGYARVSVEESVLFDTNGRILVLGRDGQITRTWRWKGDASAGGEALTDLPDGSFDGLSRLRFFGLKPRVVMGVGTIEATYAGGEEPRGIYLDLEAGIGIRMSLPAAEIADGGEAATPCDRLIATDASTIAVLRALYLVQGREAPFQAVTGSDGSAGFCVETAYGTSGEPEAPQVGGFGFISPAGEALSLPVLQPEDSMWRPVAEPGIEVEREDRLWRQILPLAGDFTVPFVDDKTFYEKAMFRGADDFSYFRNAVESARFGTGIDLSAYDLKVLAQGDGHVAIGLFADKWRHPEVCWFDAGWVVSACVELSPIYDTGGGMLLSADGRYLVVASIEIMGGHSLTLVDLAERRLRVPPQRTAKTVVDVMLDAGSETLTAIDGQGVVWSYRFPEMELISTYDLRWPEDEGSALRVGSDFLDFSSRGVVRRLDIATQVPAWIATPFDASTEIAGASVSADGAMVMVTGTDGQIRVFDAATGMPLTSAFDPGQACHGIEHDAGRRLMEISCEDGALQRGLQPQGAAFAPGLGAFSLDSPEASAAFFAGIPAFDLGEFTSSSPDVVVPPMVGTVEEFLEANGQGQGGTSPAP